MMVFVIFHAVCLVITMVCFLRVLFANRSTWVCLLLLSFVFFNSWALGNAIDSVNKEVTNHEQR